jgi:hypothetical protein
VQKNQQWWQKCAHDVVETRKAKRKGLGICSVFEVGYSFSLVDWRKVRRVKGML